MRKLIIGLCAFIVLVVIFVFYKRMTSRDAINPSINLSVTSAAFEDGGMIPVKYTGKGEDISPPIKIGEVCPEGKTIAIIMDDLDHPLGTYNHWVMWNIPADLSDIPEGIVKEEVVAPLGNAVQGKSAYGGKHYYRGPLPPFGVHRYVFKVYVLDTILELDKNADKAQLQEAMKGHIKQYGTLTGKFGS